MNRRVCAVALLVVIGAVGRAYAGSGDIVLYTSDVSTVQGNWSKASSSAGAGGQTLSSADYGWSSTTNALASPTNYFEATFTAAAGTSYHVWLRLRASGDSKWNDSVWVQFTDSTDANGNAIYRVGT